MVVFHELTIRKKLAFIMTATVAGCLLLVSFTFVTISAEFHRKTLEADLLSLANAYADTSRAAIDFDVASDGKDALQSLKWKASVERAWLIYPDRPEVLATYDRSTRLEVEEVEIPDPPFIPETIQYDQNHLYVTGQAIWEGELVARVVLMDDLSSTRDAQWRDLAVLASVALLALLALSLFVGKISVLISKPITELAETAQQVTEARDFSVRAKATEYGEIGLLIGAFNKMLDQVQIRDAALLASGVAAEQRAKEAESLRQDLDITLDSIRDGVIATDDDSRVTRMNPVAETLTGWTETEAKEHRLEEVYNLVDSRKKSNPQMSVMDLLLQEEDRTTLAKWSLVSRTGVHRRVSHSAARIFDGDRMRGAVVVCRDMTDQVELEDNLRQAQKMEAIGQVAGAIAHDFNNLMVGILGYTELLTLSTEAEGAITAEELSESIKGIRTAIDRGVDLTNQLLAFSRRGAMKRETVDVHNHIRNVVNFLRGTAKNKIDIHTNLEAKQSTVAGDAGQIETAIQNLGINACEAMPDGGTLTFETKVTELTPEKCDKLPSSPIPGHYLEITISDTGKGIAPDIREHIFEPFFTTKVVSNGKGLGLATVYGTMEAHGGTIEFESVTGRGSVFHCYLPVSLVPTTRNRSTDKTDIVHGKGLILVVDDEGACRHVAAQILRRLGYDVLVATSGEDAVRVINQEKQTVDLVLMDLQMPEMSGTETLAKMRETHADVRVVFASGLNMADPVNHVPERVVHKPYTIAELSESVAETLAGSDGSSDEKTT